MAGSGVALHHGPWKGAAVARGRGWLAGGLVVAAVAAFGAAAGLSHGAGSDQIAEQALGTTAFLAFTVGGALIVLRRPRHPIGWLFIGFGLSEAVVELSIAWARRSLVEDPGSLPGGHLAGWVYGWAWALPTFLPLFVVFLFPDGSPPGPRWRFVVRGAAIALGVLVVAASLYPDLFQDQEGWPSGLANPLGIPGATPVLEAVSALALLVLALAGVAAAASVVVRYRLAGEEQRQQLRVVLAAGFAVGVTAVLPVPDEVLILSIALLAIAATVAVLRYRLYGVQLIISRSLVYGTLAAITTFVYLALVAGVGSLAGAGSGSRLPLAVTATAVAAVAFQPVRGRVERRARRLIFGARAEPYTLLAAFSRRLSGSLPVDQVAAAVGEAVIAGLGARAVSVTVVLAGGGEESTTVPPEVGDVPVVDEVAAVHDGRVVGRVAVRATRWGAAEGKLLRDLVAQAAPSLSNVALAAELRARADALARSRRRLVAVQDRERRRMERDLHDGAQQYLLALGAQLGLARQEVATDPKLAAILERAVVLSEEAVGALRSLARGVYPHVLTDRGVTAALRVYADNAALPFDVHIEGDGRWAPELEAAVYFCCREALQNAAKHAEATVVTLVVEEVEGELRFRVTDDGKGLPADVVAGEGLANLEDRLGALGGTLIVDSAPERGTTVAGRLPLSLEAAPRGTEERPSPVDGRRVLGSVPAS